MILNLWASIHCETVSHWLAPYLHISGQQAVGANNCLANHFSLSYFLLGELIGAGGVISGTDFSVNCQILLVWDLILKFEEAINMVDM